MLESLRNWSYFLSFHLSPLLGVYVFSSPHTATILTVFARNFRMVPVDGSIAMYVFILFYFDNFDVFSSFDSVDVQLPTTLY